MGFEDPSRAFIMRFFSQTLGPNVSEEILNKWTTTEPKGAALRAAPLGFLSTIC